MKSQGMNSELCSREGEAPTALPVEGATRAPINASHVHDVMITKEAPNYRLD
jgi:hypothetical protein